MASTTLKRETMGAQIADMLRTAILLGEYEPGTPVTETALSLRFGASRGPLREAMRQLIDEGILVSIPYTGTRVLALSVDDINDIYSMRICLEIFALESIWGHRDANFVRELHARHEALLAAIDEADDVRAIEAELNLHGLAYEWSGNKLLLNTWNGIRGRLQLYWAAHHRAHGISGPKRESHDAYIRFALGDSLEEMKSEIENHMRRGLKKTKAFVEKQSGQTIKQNP